MNNSEVTGLIESALFAKSKQEFKFFHRFPMVQGVNSESDSDISVFISNVDVVKNKKDKELGTFEVESTKFTLIKVGARLQNLSDKNVAFTAKSIASALKTRLSMLYSLVICGGGSCELSGINLTVKNVPEEFHTTISNKPLGSLVSMKNVLQDLHDTQYNRITLSSTLLSLITGELQPVVAKKVLRERTGLKVEIDDSYYRQRTHSGATIQYRFLPANTVILSNSKQDNTDAFYYANTPLTGYIENDIMWGVIGGIPVLKDKTAFASIKFR